MLVLRNLHALRSPCRALINTPAIRKRLLVSARPLCLLAHSPQTGGQHQTHHRGCGDGPVGFRHCRYLSNDQGETQSSQTTPSSHASGSGSKLRVIGVVGGVTTLVGLFAWNAYRVSVWMSGLSIAHGMHFGVYLGGVASAAAAGVGYSFVRRYVSIHPESLFKDVLSRIKDDPVMLSKFGTQIAPGKFKAYAYSGGLIWKEAAARKTLLDAVSWERYGCQLIFQANGDHMSGVVSVRAEQSFLGRYFVRNLAVDFENDDRYVLIGSPEDVAYKGIIKLR